MNRHTPVLLPDIVNTFSYLSNAKGAVFVDGTLGAGGHSLAIAKKIRNSKFEIRMIGIDQDQDALEIAQKNIEEAGLAQHFTFIQRNFSQIREICDELEITEINGALLDLGVSSMQLDNEARGFSFKDPLQPLDMRMDQTQELTAATVLNTYSQDKIYRVLLDFGEERFAKRIASLITESRRNQPIKTVGDLLQILELAIPKSFRLKGKIHFATKTFQALRIEVNNELGMLEQALNDFASLLSSSGRLAVISFHSLEDRIVKQAFRRMEDPCQCPKHLPCICNKLPVAMILTRKPIIASESEKADNPRSRSAKLRIIEKL